MSKQPGRLRKILITLAKAAGVFFVLAVIAFFSLRNMLLQRVLDEVASRLKAKYNTTLTTREASFAGLTGVEIHDLTLVPEGKDTLARIGTLRASIRFWYALVLDYRIQELTVKEGYVQVVKNSEGSNIDAFLGRGREEKQGTSEQPSQGRNYARIIYKLINRVLEQVPSRMLLESLMITLSENSRYASFYVEHLSLDNEIMDSRISVRTNTFAQRWNISGTASPRNRQADVSFYTPDTGMVRIPYIDQRFHLVTGFDSIRMSLASVDMDGDELRIRGFAAVTNFLVNHPRISKKDVVIEKAEMDYNYLVGPDFMMVDSASTVRFNNVVFHPFVRYRQQPDTVYSLGVVIGKTRAQDFISSLPEGLFTHFKGMEAEGTFDYRLDFSYDVERPRDLLFESSLNKEGLKILRYGEANLSKLNGEFVYVPMEKGRPQRPVLVGAGNPNYTPIDQISPLLKKCVLTTEDPSFFYHRGFIDEAFRQSIIKNIRTRKFARGASTISMQLVKNVFLTREKTLSRKLEEILLVYILENNHLCPKERMFEVYLNIIEWGPNVYGIGEAAQYYFRKSPADLTLKESLFLATIIPRPKGFMWRFAKDGTAKDFVSRQFRFLTDLMVRREMLTPEDTMGVSQVPLLISGAAKKMIVKTDTLISDSILINDDLLDTDGD